MVLRKLFTIGADVNGRGQVFHSWNKQGTMLAIVGLNRRITIVNRQGKTLHTLNLPLQTAPIALEWDRDGEILACIQATSSSVSLWTATTKNFQNLETSIKDLCIIAWSKTDPVLAVGSVKGNLMLYNTETFKKVPVMGKHSKKIISACWNNKGQLALTSEDKTMTVSDLEANTVDMLNIKGDPTNVQWACRKVDGKSSKTADDTTVSLINSGKTLVMHSAGTKEGLVELAFNKKYGNLVTFRWFGDGYIVAAFSNGNVIIVSTHSKEIGTEISMLKAHRDQLNNLTVNTSIAKGATVGDNFVRVFDLDDLQLSEQRSEKFDFDSEFGALQGLEWTDDGQILTVSSKNGSVYNFLTRIPVLSAASGTSVVYLSSLREMTVRDIVAEADVASVELDIEPAFVALSPTTIGVGMNNEVLFFSYDPNVNGQKAQKMGVRQYPNVVEDVKISPHYVAVLLSGTSILHTIEDNPGRPQKSFPERSQDKAAMKVTCHGMTESFYCFGTNTGLCTIFSLMDHTVVTEYRHICGIRSMNPNPSGTRIQWCDVSNAGYVLNPTTEVASTIDRMAPATTFVLWDPSDYGAMVGVAPKFFTSYVYNSNTRYGSTAVAIANRQGQVVNTARPYGLSPVLAFRGVIVCQLATGALAHVPLQSHQPVQHTGSPDPEAFHFNLQLNRLTDAIPCASSHIQLREVAEKALHLLDVDLAIRVYRTLNEPAMVMALEKIQHIREKNILLGHVAVIFHQFNEAQNYFTRSSNPMLALEMRRDLMQWDQALSLAETLAPDQVPMLSKESAQQLEFRGEYSAALEMYQRGQMELPRAREDSAAAVAARSLAQAHNDACAAGSARCMIRLGSVRNGMQFAMNSNNAQLQTECAQILESMKQFEEAAQLYEKAEKYENAATIYIQNTKQLKAAYRLLPQINSRNILTMFARAKELEHEYKEAEDAYTKAEDWDNVVRIKVEFLNDLHGAHPIVRRTRSAEAASIVAAVCRKKGEHAAAIEFLLLAKKTDEAFEVAKSNKAMAAFEAALIQQVALKDGVAPQQHRSTFAMIAQYYEGLGNNELAGDFYKVAGQFDKALEKFLKVGSDEYIGKAVEVVGRARSEALTHKVLDFLMGTEDGDPKDPNWIFRLYIALNNYEKAAKTAVVIANRDQELGNYKASHKILIDTVLVLQERAMRVPTDLKRTLQLVHSYLIVKHLVKPMDDPIAATRMLLKVARNIQKFPQHMAAILTSVVLQCVKTEFKASAYQYACALVQTEELKGSIPEKSRKKVEQVVRKRGKEELHDPPEQPTLCPFCQAPVPETTLDCGACKNTIPMCIVTGRHMVLDDWAQCPTCKFPALFSQLLKLTKDDPRCPMCEHKINPLTLSKIESPDPKSYS